MRSESVFERVFDVGVFGAGYIGAGAARRLLARGLTVLVVEPAGQWLWESSRALENRIGGDVPCDEWRLWVEEMERRGAVRSGCVDGAFAEIATAREWLGAVEAGRLGVLFYALPAPASEAKGAGKAGVVTVATKGGWREVQARRWLDASERGGLAAHYGAARGDVREERERFWGMALQSRNWNRHEAAVRAFCEARGAELRMSARESERRLVWRVDGASKGGEWHRGVVEWMTALRGELKLGTDVVVSHCAMEAFPIWNGNETKARPAQEQTGTPPWLWVASPALRNVELNRIGERFAWGVACAEAVCRAGEEGDGKAPHRCASDGGETAAPEWTSTCDVLVAGAGTAGALAAISAARAGAKVCVVDLASFPGGVGTGAAISGYFHGAEGGGLQEETDARVAELNALLEGERGPARRWHHDGKKIALLEFFAREGVEFRGEGLLHGVERDDAGRVRSVMVATRRGRERIEARAFIDSTGDGDLCALAGAEFLCGRPGDGRSLAFSQSSLVLKGGGAAGEKLDVCARNFDAGWVDATDAEALSRARLLGVAQHWLPEWTGEDRPLAVAALPGIRQSRSIVTDYMLTLEDLAEGRHFPDGICRVKSIADTHSVDFEFETDEAAFYFWACRLSRLPLVTSLPYRAMLPRGLSNVWVACRAAGMDATAAYAARMQRDMQRLGVAAGVAAAMAARDGGDSRSVPVKELQARLGSDGTGAGCVDAEFTEAVTDAAWAASPASGKPGLHLWRLFCSPERYRDLVKASLDATEASASFYAATVLAMWGDEAAESRLIDAVERREAGPPASPENAGAYGQEIDVPFWFLAVVLLRRCGSMRCVPALRRLVEGDEAARVFNVRTAITLTVERLLAERKIGASEATAVVERLLAHGLSKEARMLAPSRSIWRALRGEPQLKLRNDCGVDTRQDHAWQLERVVGRINAMARVEERGVLANV